MAIKIARLFGEYLEDVSVCDESELAAPADMYLQ